MLVIVPAAAVPIVAFGRSNCAVFSRLKHSARNCSRTAWLAANSLKIDTSTFSRPGPYKMFLPASPYTNWAGV